MSFTSASTGRARHRARMEPPERDTRARAQEAGIATIVKAVVEGLRVSVALAGDPRVAGRDKAMAALALVYLVFPIDLIPDMFLGFGQLDDLGLIFWGWRRLLQGAGRDLIAEHWRGDTAALDLVLGFAGVED